MSSIKAFVRERLPVLFSLLSKLKYSVRKILVERQKKKLPRLIKAYFQNSPEHKELINYVETVGVEMIPYPFASAYREMPVTIRSEHSFHVATVNGDDIYFPSSMSRQYVLDSVRVGLMEQDANSPHRYLPINGLEIGGDAAVICGASDCIYALKIIDRFQKLYLFEANEEWIEPIKKTLRNYLHKIEIVPKYISNLDDGNFITLDTFFKSGMHRIDFIQADIEGFELKMLQGAKDVLHRSQSMKLAICCYHTPYQEEELTRFLTGEGFRVRPADGYLLLWVDYPLKPPYLRRGVLYAYKS
jgi:hypothetical protein